MMQPIGNFFLNDLLIELAMIKGYTYIIRLCIDECKSKTFQKFWTF